jgi:hypothetical protein
VLCHEGLVSGISSAYLSSGVSTRGQRRLHHAANGGLFAREEGDDAPQNSCRTIRKLKGEFAFRAVLVTESIWRERVQKC